MRIFLGVERVIPYLGKVVRETREAKELERIDIGVILRKHQDSVKNFEEGQTGEPIDRTVAAYAQVTDLDIYSLWRQAIDRAEAASKPTGAGKTAAAAREEMQRQRARLESELAELDRRLTTSEPRTAKSKRASQNE